MQCCTTVTCQPVCVCVCDLRTPPDHTHTGCMIPYSLCSLRMRNICADRQPYHVLPKPLLFVLVLSLYKTNPILMVMKIKSLSFVFILSLYKTNPILMVMKIKSLSFVFILSLHKTNPILMVMKIILEKLTEGPMF